MSWKEEDEYIDEEKNSDTTSQGGFPVPVAQRMVAYAERTGKKIEDIKQIYIDYIKNEYGVEDWKQEMKTFLLIGQNKCLYKQENKQQVHREHLHG